METQTEIDGEKLLMPNEPNIRKAPMFRFGSGIGSMIMLPIFALLMVLIGPVAICYGIYTRVALEWDYQARYGDTWKEQYLEEQKISVADTNKKIFVGSGGMVVIFGLGYAIYRQIVPKRRGHRRSHRHRSSSPSLQA
jgi:hypothetical protein